MRCPFCAKEATTIIETRALEGYWAIRRRRECLECGKRFATFEILRDDFNVVEALRRIRDSPEEADGAG